MTINEQYKKWQENTLKKSLDKFKERKERFEYSSGLEVPRLAMPGLDTDGGFDTPSQEHAGLLNQRLLQHTLQNKIGILIGDLFNGLGSVGVIPGESPIQRAHNGAGGETRIG